MNSDEVRQEFLSFFESKGHLVIPSSSLIPIGDPTLLLTSAGVVQVIPYFSGEATPPGPRLASCQKCFRTTDIDTVGDADHLTFFEMLGNFSVGDYFKKEAIAWAWELSTERFKMPPERLWVSVFLDDDESYGYWIDQGVPPERIVRYGEEENWWGPPGDQGPCGPCTEIYYDFGEEYSCGKPDCGPACDCNRFTEFYNLVLTEYYQDLEGNRTLLPKGNIDTGLGLERTATVLQGVTNVYESDCFKEIMDRVTEVTGHSYGTDQETDVAMRVLAEHGRGVTFLITDGVVPSNEGRGYVLRRILRRAVTFARKLGVEEPALVRIAEAVIDKMGGVYPDLVLNREFTLKVIEQEETRFYDTLGAGMSLLDRIIGEGGGRAAGGISGADVFKLYDTYGFPPELTEEVAGERGLSVDMEGFRQEMERQKERGRAAHTFKKDRGAEIYASLGLGVTRFTGYETLAGESVVVGLLAEGISVHKVGAGERAELITMESPFYAEGGGQVGDRGEITSPQGRFAVEDTQVTVPGFYVHQGRVVDGDVSVGDPVNMKVDPLHRRDSTRNHTATHLLHAALRQVLGGHVRQSGSLVAPERLRFDFTHPVGLSHADLRDVRDLVNENIRADLLVTTDELPYSDAISRGALAFFGDKYPEVVRIIEMGSGDQRFSFEVCGGTHAKSTGEVWNLQISDEGSIGSGLRRIEAVTGVRVQELVGQRFDLVDALALELQTSPDELPERVSALVSELEAERKRASGLERELARREAEDLVGKVQQVDGANVVAARVKAASVEAMREMGDLLKARLDSVVVVLASVINDKPLFVAMVTPDLVAKGLHAGNIVKQVASITGGGGGGRPELAQAGGKDVSKISHALDAVPQAIRQTRG
ncbi:MAG: alanine--tRNA ligase [Chloroflexi bacterium]|nr:alanine--tRNA ligase [Chloroflexota bacterium]